MSSATIGTSRALFRKSVSACCFFEMRLHVLRRRMRLGATPRGSRLGYGSAVGLPIMETTARGLSSTEYSVSNRASFSTRKSFMVTFFSKG